MIKFLIYSSKKNKKKLKNINDANNKITYKNLTVHYSDPFHEWINSDNQKCIILGDINGLVNKKGVTKKVSKDLKSFEILENFDRVSEIEGRYVFIKVSENGKCEIWSDHFGKIDIYKQTINSEIILSSSLDLLTISNSNKKIDEVGLAHSLIIYGSRPAKKHTLYKEVSRLGINEGFCLFNGENKLLKRSYIAKSTEPKYNKDKLEDYADFFIESVRSRASEKGNVIYLSSGWDSTSILAVLVHLFGSSKTRCIIGRQKFSQRSGICNQIEIDKATAICEYFDVKLDIVDFDFRTGAEDIIQRSKGFFKSHQFANMTSITHFLLAEAASKMVNGDEKFFAGEMSDGAHNLGFSQYATIFHAPSQHFREYSDKMASYLYGPTFLKEMIRGAHEDDPIWKIFMQINFETKFDKLKNSEKEIIKQFFSTFFLRGGRIPLYSIENSNILTKFGGENFVKSSEELYLKEASEQANPDTLYSHFLQLYNTFHWQGSTVLTLEYTVDLFGLKMELPFRDQAVLNFLSGMPEDWGRGLDFNNTKYPLKWMLKNKIDYPYHLQEGPHSYTYDVDPSFNHQAEIIYASSFNQVFKDALKKGEFVNSLDPKIFNIPYINEVVQEFLDGKECRGARMNDLCTLATHSTIGLF